MTFSAVPSRVSNLRVNSDRLWSRHIELARIGAIAGDGSCRLALTAEDSEARHLFASWCRAAGMELRTDRAGNMFAIRAGAKDLPVVAAGSHLDTQPHGGRFDGVSGVLAALEVAETLNDAGIATVAPLAIINWTNEEGVRFAPGLLGSSWFVEALADDTLAKVRSADGVAFAEEAYRLGWSSDQGPRSLPIGSFFELHIEQGPILEQRGDQVGIVTSVQGLRWLDVAVTGTDAHAGTTPLDHRQDALLAAARMIVAVNDAGRACGPDARVSVGRIKTATDGPSTIVGEASFVIDVRHPKAEVLDELAAECARICGEVGHAARCDVSLSERIAIPPTDFDEGCVNALEVAAQEMGLRHSRIASGALHDASNIATVAPTAMIFVPCRDGMSHNVKEYASPEDLAAGATVLMHAMLSKAELVSQ